MCEILINLPFEVKKIIEIINSHSYAAYAVGGCVRDMVMGNIPNDYDITTSAQPEKIIEIFNLCGIRTIPTGIQHGTVSVLMSDKIYEITTFRTDGDYKDSRHPESVSFTDKLSDDLVRRDFTINAMAADIDGNLYDLFGGVEDIKNKILRCVGDPYKRFSEDALRILRGVRFSSRLGFEIEDSTYLAAKELGYKLHNVSVERKISELSGILMSDGANAGIKTIFELGIEDHIIKGLKAPIMNIDNCPKTFECRMAALICGSDNVDLSTLKLSNQQRKDISLLLQKPSFENSDICARRILKEYKNLAIDVCLLYGQNDVANLVREQIKLDPCTSISQLAVNGNDIISLGIDKRNISKVLNFALDKVIESPKFNQKDKLLQYIKDNHLI